MANTQTKLERKINRLLKKETKRWMNIPGFSHVSFVINNYDVCDIINMSDGRRYCNSSSSYKFGSPSMIRRLKIEYMIQQTGCRYPDKEFKFVNPNIISQYKTYGEFFNYGAWDITCMLKSARKNK